MEMTRRQFIQACSAMVAATAITPGAVAVAERLAYPGFDPRCGYGDFAFICEGLTDDVIREARAAIFNEQINHVIPPSYRYRIRFAEKPLGSYGTSDPLVQRFTIAWKYSPRPSPPELIVLGGGFGMKLASGDKEKAINS